MSKKLLNLNRKSFEVVDFRFLFLTLLIATWWFTITATNIAYASDQPQDSQVNIQNTQVDLYWFSVNWTNAFKRLHLFLSDLPLANQGFFRHKGIKNTF